MPAPESSVQWQWQLKQSLRRGYLFRPTKPSRMGGEVPPGVVESGVPVPPGPLTMPVDLGSRR